MIRVQARALQQGDVVGSGETVAWVGVGVRTPAGRVEVILDKDGRRRIALWRAGTMIGVSKRKEIANA